MQQAPSTNLPTAWRSPGARLSTALPLLFRLILTACIVLQIAFGSLWMLRNFTHLMPFGDTVEYVKLSQSLMPDEYRPILFPLILRACTHLEALSGIYMGTWLYILATLCSLGALVLFFTALFAALECRGVLAFKTAARRGAIALCSAYVLTSPLIAQFNFAVLTDGLANAFLVAMLALVLACAYVGWDRWYHFTAIGVCALVQSLLRLERFYVCLVLLAALALWVLLVRRRARYGRLWPTAVKFAAVIAILAVAVPAINAQTQTTGAEGRAPLMLSGTLAGRFAWSHLEQCYDDFSPLARSVISVEQAKEIDAGTLTLPNLMYQSGVTREEMDAIYYNLAFVVLRRVPDYVFMAMLDDWVNFFVVPYHLVASLNNLTPSVTAWNFQCMAQAHPVYTSGYFRFSIYTQFFVLGTALVLSLRNREGVLRRSLPFTVPLIAAAALIAAVFTAVSGGGTTPNYRYALLAYMMWLTWFLLAWCERVLRRYPRLVK